MLLRFRLALHSLTRPSLPLDTSKVSRGRLSVSALSATTLSVYHASAIEQCKHSCIVCLHVALLMRSQHCKASPDIVKVRRSYAAPVTHVSTMVDSLPMRPALQSGMPHRRACHQPCFMPQTLKLPSVTHAPLTSRRLLAFWRTLSQRPLCPHWLATHLSVRTHGLTYHTQGC